MLLSEELEGQVYVCYYRAALLLYGLSQQAGALYVARLAL